MSVAVALICPRGSFIGADSAASDDGLIATSSLPKACRVGDRLFAYAGAIKGGQWFLEFARRHPEMPIRRMLDEVPDTVARDDGFSILAIEGSRLLELTSTGGVISYRPREGVTYAAIGSGDAVALGSLYAWHDGRQSVRCAMAAAAFHTLKVRPPFRVLSL